MSDARDRLFEPEHGRELLATSGEVNRFRAENAARLTSEVAEGLARAQEVRDGFGAGGEGET